jgi:hypothetical protein
VRSQYNGHRISSALRYPFSGEGSGSIPSPVKPIQAQQSNHIANDDDDEWELIAEYATNHQQAMDVHEIIDCIYRHAENFMHGSESVTVTQPDYVGKPQNLYLWCLILESKTCLQYACPMCYSCRCDASIRLTETKQTLKLELIGVHDRHSHIGGKMHACKSAWSWWVFSPRERSNCK